jgi:spermidine synthase
MTQALVLAFLSGFVALSYEILWYRAYSFVSRGAAPAFALLLALYLAGIALGSRASRRFCSGEEPGRLSLALGRFILLANVLGYLFVPFLSWVVTWNDVAWTHTVPLVAVVSCGLGAILPLVSHQAVAPDARAGARVSWIYFANILGSASGSLLTGFWLTDLWSLRQISLFLAILGAIMGAVALQAGVRGLRLAPRLLAAAAVAGLAAILNPWIFDGLYERMVHEHFYQPSFRFSHVVENRSGVITVYPDGTFLGGGQYDGSVNTCVTHDRNGVFRAYAVSGLHHRPREVLMVGLSTGSWASAVAENPEVERLTVVEINRGYLDLLRHYPEVAGVLDHPKVRIEIGDARRWLVRNRDRKFDVIISNTTPHWRSHVTNLLSLEFMELARSRLNPGGILFYGTTGSVRAARTGLAVFPHGLELKDHNGWLALGESPVEFSADRWKQVMRRTHRLGRPKFDPGSPAAQKRLDELAERLQSAFQPSDDLRRKVAGEALLTDDSMGGEWTQYPLD